MAKNQLLILVFPNRARAFQKLTLPGSSSAEDIDMVCMLLGQTAKATSPLKTQQGACQKFALGWEGPKPSKPVWHLTPHAVTGILSIYLHFQAPKDPWST